MHFREGNGSIGIVCSLCHHISFAVLQFKRECPGSKSSSIHHLPCLELQFSLSVILILKCNGINLFITFLKGYIAGHSTVAIIHRRHFCLIRRLIVLDTALASVSFYYSIFKGFSIIGFRIIYGAEGNLSVSFIGSKTYDLIIFIQHLKTELIPFHLSARQCLGSIKGDTSCSMVCIFKPGFFCFIRRNSTVCCRLSCKCKACFGRFLYLIFHTGVDVLHMHLLLVFKGKCSAVSYLSRGSFVSKFIQDHIIKETGNTFTVFILKEQRVFKLILQ